jgi:hypothetical protein
MPHPARTNSLDADRRVPFMVSGIHAGSVVALDVGPNDARPLVKLSVFGRWNKTRSDDSLVLLVTPKTIRELGPLEPFAAGAEDDVRRYLDGTTIAELQAEGAARQSVAITVTLPEPLFDLVVNLLPDSPAGETPLHLAHEARDALALAVCDAIAEAKARG